MFKTDDREVQIREFLKTKMKNLFTLKQLLRKVPVLEWLPKYRRSYLLADIVAGLTVAMTVIPQGIADAALAGLPTQYGLYAGFMGCFVYFVFGSVKDLTVGPTAILSLLTYTVVKNLNADLAVLSTLISGCLIFISGLFNLGFLMQFISAPTIVGFMNGATVTIAIGQIRRLLGITSGKSSEFVDSLETLYHHYNETRLNDALLGISSLILLVGIRYIAKKYRKSIGLRYLSISRNAIVVFGGILLAFLLHEDNKNPFIITGEITSGFPSISLPPFSTTHENKVYNFTDMIRALGLSLFTIPIISIIESVAIAKSFSKGKIVDVTQEMLALGLANFASSFVSSIPVTGSFSRSAVNHASGVKTQMGGVVTGSVVLLALGVLTQAFYYIPKCCLAAVIIAAMFTMMEIKKVVQIYQTRKIDILPFLGTFLVSLWRGLEMGILVGVVINVLFILYSSSRPKISIDVVKLKDEEILLISPNRDVIYSSAEYFKMKSFKESLRHQKIKNIVINGNKINSLDSTSVMNIAALIDDLTSLNKKTILWNWNEETSRMMIRYDNTVEDTFIRCDTIDKVLNIEDNELVKVENV